MALIVLTNAYILLNGTADVSDHCSKVAFEAEAAELDSTTFSAGGWASVELGLKKGNLGLDLKADYAAAALDSILWPLFGTKVAFEIRAVNSARSTSNPAYTGTLAISKLQPINGGVGDLGEMGLQFPTSGTVTRATS